MAVFEIMRRPEAEHDSLVLVRLALPFAFPIDRASFLPVRGDVCREHIFLDRFGIHERVPYDGRRGLDGRGGFRNQIVAHDTLLCFSAALAYVVITRSIILVFA